MPAEFDLISSMSFLSVGCQEVCNFIFGVYFVDVCEFDIKFTVAGAETRYLFTAS